MDGLKAQSVQDKHWYLAVGDRSIGPLTTELVMRGIQSGKVPLTAWICQVGAASWSALSSHDEFQDILQLTLASRAPANQQNDQQQSSIAPKGTRARISIPAPPASIPLARGTCAAPVDASDGPEDCPATAAYHAENVSEEPHQGASRAALPYEYSEVEPLPSFADESSEPELITSAPAVASELVQPAYQVAAFEEPDPTAVSDALPSFAEESGEHDVRPALRAGSWTASEPAAVPQVPEPMWFGTTPETTGSISAADDTSGNDELGIDITFDEDDSCAIDWKERFQSYFLVGTEVELPEESSLIQSLGETPRSTFQHDEALWNLSLCMAFGSDRVAAVSAGVFFGSFEFAEASERIEWICRTLLSKGFMPSGIPRHAGARGIRVLRAACPPEHRAVFEREACD